ncbi:DUF1501 domain-containing protein [Roseateles chitosanitabidus]|jgi:uncharacterized protein (DUF1501 family)|uniref:DUF1501 domain-containing protein n=1 Tax=Roseateles chitosanitabidus TaxID=65048 RepID=UPI000835800C|nr:DUF1501 domain-containing protein [Roseateles chitosanitabidus]MBO9686469.1 DUF1501 domain-containing protein [Roseateles chitosanitabidus]
MAHVSRLPSLHRREFLKRASAVSVAGAAAPWALQLAAIGDAAAATSGGDYKALVCVFLYGGNDYANTVIPYDTADYQAYAAIRPTLAIGRDALAATALSPTLALPDGRQMALAPGLSAIKPVFDAGRLGVMLNIGTLTAPMTLAQYKSGAVPAPPKLFSHNDQSSLWQSSNVEGARTGWGGRMADMMLSANGRAGLTCINVSGNAIFQAGDAAFQYLTGPGGKKPITGIGSQMFGSSSCAKLLKALITEDRTHAMESELNRVTARSIDLQAALSTALTGGTTLSTAFAGDALARQLKMVASLIAARSALGMTRQVYFVAMGGFDLHDALGTRHPALMQQVGGALASFDGALQELGVADQVTAFTASDFGRTLSSNGDGTDHGWGSHHFVMGGAVRGGRFYGTAPSVSVNGPDDVGQGRLLPTTSVDQLAATLALWMGVPATDLRTVLPNIGNFAASDLGFMR